MAAERSPPYCKSCLPPGATQSSVEVTNLAFHLFSHYIGVVSSHGSHLIASHPPLSIPVGGVPPISIVQPASVLSWPSKRSNFKVSHHKKLNRRKVSLPSSDSFAFSKKCIKTHYSSLASTHTWISKYMITFHGRPTTPPLSSMASNAHDYKSTRGDVVRKR